MSRTDVGAQGARHAQPGDAGARWIAGRVNRRIHEHNEQIGDQIRRTNDEIGAQIRRTNDHVSHQVRQVGEQIRQAHEQVHENLADQRRQVAADLRKLADDTGNKAGNAWQRFLHRPWSNPWRIFGRDVKAVCTNVIGLIVAVGLIVIPAFYSWFNIAGAWNVYDNTGGLKVAVADQDSGYQSDLLPMKVNVGEQLTSALRSNKQLGWTFVSRSEAVDGVYSGKYYAAIVIPKSFSSDMMTFFTPNMKKAKIVYYENEKENPLAPKITDTGADTIRSQVNGTFSSTLTSVALDLATTLGKFLDSPNARSAMTSFVSNIDTLAGSASSAAGLVGSYGSIITSAADVVSSASAVLPATSSLTRQARTATKKARADAKKADASLSAVSSSLTSAATRSQKAAQQISKQASAVFDDASASATTTASRLDSLAGQADDLAARNTDLKNSVDRSASTVEGLLSTFDEQHPSIPSGVAGAALRAQRAALVAAHDALTTYSADLGRVASALSQTGSDLSSAASDVRSKTADAAQTKKGVTDKLASAASQLRSLAHESSTGLSSGLSSLGQALSPVMDGAVGVASDADATLSALSRTTNTTATTMRKAATSLAKTQKRLQKAAKALSGFSAKVSAALESGNAKQLAAVTRSSSDKLAGLIAAPISVKRHAVYPVATFGAQMTPFYGVLATWVGSTLLAAAITPTVSARRRRGLRRLRPYHLYFGRQLSFTFLALLQSTLLGLGCLFFLGVKAVHPFLFMVTMWATGLTFSIIMFTLGYTLGYIGKAICVILLVVQISGSNGMYPVVLMPKFFSAVMPFLPATHAMNALRECIGGFYGTAWYADMGKLLVFIVPMLFISLALKKPLSLLSDAFARATHASNLLP